jgi:hypothetical protein
MQTMSRAVRALPSFTRAHPSRIPASSANGPSGLRGGQSNQAIQAKLAVGAANDPLEHEADRVADAVMSDRAAPAMTAVPAAAQRKCASCEEDDAALVQRKAASFAEEEGGVPPEVHDVVRAEGRPLDPETRAYFEPRFGRDFGQVRIHDDTRAANSARLINALAYTVGPKIVFGAGQYSPGSPASRKLLAHELAHTVQQGSGAIPASAPPVTRTRGGGYRIATGVHDGAEPAHLESQADQAASQVTREGSADSLGGPALSSNAMSRSAIQRARVPVPDTPLCGKTLTHLDIEPPRWRDLEPCKPKGFKVMRMNIVGRDLSGPSPGKGRQVFNLHVGYYTDPVTGRYCAIADDSKKCVMGRCQELGCFPTLSEVFDAIIEFLKTILKILGIIALAILLAMIIELLLGGGLEPAGGTPVPTMAGGGGRGGAGGGDGEEDAA